MHFKLKVQIQNKITMLRMFMLCWHSIWMWLKALNEINHLRPEPAHCPSTEFKSKTASWKTQKAKWATIITLPATHICIISHSTERERERNPKPVWFSIECIKRCLASITFLFFSWKVKYLPYSFCANKFTTTLGLRKQWQWWPLTNLYNFKRYM